MHDALTGLYNRHYLQLHLPRLHGRALESGRPLGLIVCDLDHFKTVNDGFGHAAGDAVLREFANRIAGTVRGVDIVARMGGEEFVVAMPETTLEMAMVIGERLRQRVAEEKFQLPGGEDEISVTVSIGAAMQDGEDDTPERMIARADAALYRAKREGRNRVVSAAAAA